MTGPFHFFSEKSLHGSKCNMSVSSDVNSLASSCLYFLNIKQSQEMISYLKDRITLGKASI